VDFNKHRNIIRIKILILLVKVGSRLNNSSDASQNDSFVFSAAQYKFTTTTDGKDVITRRSWNAFGFELAILKLKLLRLRL
jgi:hypothetical protein